jgi:hypothetical protein
MHEIGLCASRSLSAASQYGHVIIITNSDEGWVEHSAQTFLPALVPYLKNYTIISARARFQKLYPSRPLCWKAAAFAHEVTGHFASLTGDSDTSQSSSSNSPTLSRPPFSKDEEDPQLKSSNQQYSLDSTEFLNRKGQETHEIISFGDSLDEHTALTIVASQLDAIPKSITFLSSPSPLEIIGQHMMVTQHMEYICCHPWSLDFELSLVQKSLGD